MREASSLIYPLVILKVRGSDLFASVHSTDCWNVTNTYLDEPGLYKNPLAGFPQLIGASRKSFLGAILAEDPHGRRSAPNERIFATATAVSCAVQQGALVVRVHDVQEMADVVKVADSIWSV